jgi:DeoR family transcriptional regulator, aga operon transcriptional repressor
LIENIMASDQRSKQILDLLTRTRRVEVDALVTQLGTSPATVRRELAKLETQGFVKRDRGGASLAVPSMFEPFLGDDTFASQIFHMEAEKTRIGAAAASLVHDGDVVGLAPGTTTTHVARFLMRRSNLTIVTNAVNVAMELSRKRDFRIHLTGGLLSGDWFAMVGARALEAIPEIKMDFFFFGANGASVQHGITDRHEEEAAVNRAMLRHARQCVLVADHSKLDHVAQFLVCPFNAVNTLVTDDEAPVQLLTPVREAGVEILLA